MTLLIKYLIIITSTVIVCNAFGLKEEICAGQKDVMRKLNRDGKLCNGVENWKTWFHLNYPGCGKDIMWAENHFKNDGVKLAGKTPLVEKGNHLQLMQKRLLDDSSRGRELLSEWNGTATTGSFNLVRNVTKTSSTINVDGKLEIIGIVGDDGVKPAIDGGNTPGCTDNCPGHMVFKLIHRNHELRLTNIAIQNGHSGGGLYVYSGSAILTSCTVSSNTAGGGFCILGGSVTLTSCTISSNVAAVSPVKNGGGIYVIITFAKLFLNNCIFEGNTALDDIGGALYIDDHIYDHGSAQRGELSIINTSFFHASDTIYFKTVSSSSCISPSSCISGGGGIVSNYNSSECSHVFVCGKCPKGRYHTESECLQCFVGRYTDQLGESSCKQCKVGLYNSENGMASCKPCEIGNYCLGGMNQTKCPRGSYQDKVGKSNCTVCPGGKYQEKTGQRDVSSCKACDAGKYLPPNTNFDHHKSIKNCIECAKGQYKSSGGASECDKCSIGKYFYPNVTGRERETDACKRCAKNTFTSSRGLMRCTACDVGKTANDAHTSCVTDGNNDDTSAPIIDTVQSANEQHRSLDITWTVPLNTNNNTIEIESIVVTATNEETNTEEIEKSFKPDATKGRLDELAVEHQIYKLDIKFKYKSGTNSSKNSWSKLWKTTNDCRDDEFYLDATGNNMMKWNCKSCPDGASCKGAKSKNDLYAKFGYWGYNKTQYYPCLRSQACFGGKNQEFKDRFKDANDDKPIAFCADGYLNGSRLCASCDLNYARGSSLGECKVCHTETDVVGFIVGVLVATGGTFILIKITVFKERKVNFSDGVKKIALSYLQTVLLARNMNVPWNNTFRQLFLVQDVVAHVLAVIFSLDCVLSTATAWSVFVLRYVCVLILPILIVPLTIFCMKSIGGNKEQIVATLVLLWYLMFPTFIQSFAKLISCTESIGTERLHYLKLDPEIVCWRDTHLIMFFFGGLLSLTYIIGFPSVGLYVLRKIDRDLPENRLKYGMLYDGYNNQYYYWEIIMILRKILIVVIGTFVADSQQILCVLFILASLIFLTAYYQPFMSSGLLHLELGSLSLAYFTYSVGGLLQTDPTCADDNGFWCEFSAYFVTFVNVIGFFYLAYIFATAKWKEKANSVMAVVRRKCSCCYAKRNDLNEHQGNRNSRNTWYDDGDAAAAGRGNVEFAMVKTSKAKKGDGNGQKRKIETINPLNGINLSSIENG